MQHPDVDPGIAQEPTGLRGLGSTEVRQLDVLPAGEEVEGVPLGLPVAKEDQLWHAPERSHSRHDGPLKRFLRYA